VGISLERNCTRIEGERQGVITNISIGLDTGERIRTQCGTFRVILVLSSDSIKAEIITMQNMDGEWQQQACWLDYQPYDKERPLSKDMLYDHEYVSINRAYYAV
jgi:hypothetical protein